MSREKKLGNIYQYIVLLGLLVPVLYISRYARPVVDDFDYGLFTQPAIENGVSVFGIIKGAWDSCCYMYREWQGTYSSCFIMPLHPGVYAEKLYGLSTWILMTMLWSGFFILFLTIKKHCFYKKTIKCGYLALLSTVVISLGMPFPVEGLYWYVGAMHYIPWIMTTIINMAILMELYFCEDKKKYVLLTILSCIVSFLTSGGNQCTAFANILLLTLFGGWFVYKKKVTGVVLSFVFAVAGFVIMWIAPGNSVRQSNFAPPGAVKTIIASVKYAMEYTMEWSNLILVAIIILFLPFMIKISIEIKNSIVCQYPLVTMLASIMIFCGMLCVPYYGMGYMGPNRLINIIWMYFIIAVLFNLTCILGYLEHRYKMSQLLMKVYVEFNNMAKLAIFTVCVCFVFVFSSSDTEQLSTSSEAIREIVNGEVQKYAEEFDERLVIYKDDSIKNVVLSPLTAKPRLLFMEDLSDDPQHWTNISVAQYYDKNYVVVE